MGDVEDVVSARNARERSQWRQHAFVCATCRRRTVIPFMVPEAGLSMAVEAHIAALEMRLILAAAKACGVPVCELCKGAEGPCGPKGNYFYDDQGRLLK
jgi:hypothetical protein